MRESPRMSSTFPVFIQVRGGERTRVGSATREADGSFTLQLGDLVIGSAPVAAASAPSARAASAPRSSSGLPTVFPNYGRSKGGPISGASQGDLEFYANGARRSLSDPSKERFHDKERQLLQAIEEELARQGAGGGSQVNEYGGGGSYGGGGGGGGGGFGDEPPPHGDDDNIPF